ncbi:MAG: flavodoxin domain-containing protein [Gorillibacterium sp.]|nr:flavodoxin domain-containing protein [Gorillibacterium sp.]
MKVLILYTSLTGNTESMAENVAEGVKEAGAEPVLKEVFNTQASDLLNYDGCILGA